MLDCNCNFKVLLFCFNVERLVVEGVFALVEILNVVRNATLIAESVLLFSATVKGHTKVLKDDGHTTVEICHVSHTVCDDVVVELFTFENALVRFEGDATALVFGLAHQGQRIFDNTALHLAACKFRRVEVRSIKISVTGNLNVEPL